MPLLGLTIKAVSTSVPRKKDGVKGYQNVARTDLGSASSSSSGSEIQTEVDEREKPRRMKISKANKGKMPRNKGGSTRAQG
ncbi:hypothetical protein OROMI_004539 [Orobanche minor]